MRVFHRPVARYRYPCPFRAICSPVTAARGHGKNDQEHHVCPSTRDCARAGDPYMGFALAGSEGRAEPDQGLCFTIQAEAVQ
jgi:hypothetical protein